MSSGLYVEGNIIYIDVVEPGKPVALHHAFTPLIKVQVLRVIHPVTLSVVLEVRVLSPDNGEISGLELLPSRTYILKLYDPRFSTGMREEFKISNWSSAREEALSEFIRMGKLPAFLSAINDDWIFQKGDWNDAQEEAFLADYCSQMHRSETRAYKRLEHLQGDCIPTMYANVTLSDGGCYDTNDTTATQDGEQTRKASSSSLEIKGILIEHIDGFLLDDLAVHAPESSWADICEQAIVIVNKISDCDLMNKDTRPTNVIVSDWDSKPNRGWRVVVIDFALSVLREQGKSDEEWREQKRIQDEEGAIGYVMEMKLKTAKQAGRKKYKGPLPWVYRPSGRYSEAEDEEQSQSIPSLGQNPNV